MRKRLGGTCVLVPKPGGKVRLCVDYQKLNTVTKPDIYLLSRLEDVLHSTGDASHISTFDLRAEYYQISVTPQEKDKTAFITPFGLYRFHQLPFGLRNASVTFQRLIDRLKTKIERTMLLEYLDDLSILSPTDEMHLSEIFLTSPCFPSPPEPREMPIPLRGSQVPRTPNLPSRNPYGFCETRCHKRKVTPTNLK